MNGTAGKEEPAPRTSSSAILPSLAEIRREKLCIWKNLIVISTSFLLLLMSFTSLIMLQSSLNASQGLGTHSLIAINVGLVISSLFLVSLVIDRLTPKWTIVVCEFCYLGYTVAQFYPTFYTLLPTGLLVGLAASPVWSAQCKYISVLGKRYSDMCRLQKLSSTPSAVVTDNESDPAKADTEGTFTYGAPTIQITPASRNGSVSVQGDVSISRSASLENGYYSRRSTKHNLSVVSDESKFEKDQSMVMLFFGIYFATFQSAGIWGNMITSLVLSSGDEWSSAASAEGANMTSAVRCGAHFCEHLLDEIDNLKRPEEWKIRIMLYIFVACTLSAAIPVIIFLDPITRFQTQADEEQETTRLQGCSLAFSTLKQMLDPRQALISVLVFYSGVFQGFFDGDFTKGFVGCAWGISKIGYVLMAAEATNSIGSVISGRLVKYTGRIPVFIGAFVINAVGIVHMLLWDPKPDQEYVLFIMATVLMSAEAVWQTHISGLHGVLFPDNMEAAFGVYKVFEGFGFMIAFFANPVLCMDVKLYAMLALLFVGILCYCLLEVLESKRHPGGHRNNPRPSTANSDASSYQRGDSISRSSRRIAF